MAAARDLSILLLLATTSLVWGQSKEELNQARANYQQAVAAHGPNSPEAKNARQNLRQTRHAFHAQRRQRQLNRHGR